MRYFVVDAFSENLFGGNPAGVCVLDAPISAERMQRIATENNLSETAFLLPAEDHYTLQWFTPKAEIDLCGHATLGTAFVIKNFVDKNAQQMRFATRSGTLYVRMRDDKYVLDFPARMPKRVPVTQEMTAALQAEPLEAYLSRDLMLVLPDEAQVASLDPDFEKIAALEAGLGVIVTAKGKRYDFVSRCFFPKLGVPEDPVTGSAHCNLIPYWAERLKKQEMTAAQLSARGGVLYCENKGDRVEIGGKAVLYLQGELMV